MSRKTTRALISVVVIGGALAALLATTMRGNVQYYMHVDEVMPTATAWYGKSLKLHGFVEVGSILKRTNALDYRFRVKNGDSVVLASYTGVVPDGFKDGAEVVLDGRLGPDGFHVDPSGISAKCPSKYDPAQSQVR